MKLVLDLQKSVKAGKKKLPPGGEWRTIRGAKVYIHNGRIVAGAEGKLNDFDTRDLQALHEARTSKKDTATVIHEGVSVKVGKERKTGTVVKVTATTYHIDYGNGNVRKVGKNQVRRADAYKLKLEEKTTPIYLDEDGKPKMRVAIPKADAKVVAAKEQERKEIATATEGPVREIAVQRLSGPLMRRSADGAPLKEDGRYVYEMSDSATEEDMLRDHKGLLISEVVKPYARRYGLEFMQRQWFDENGNPSDLFGDLYQEANIGFLYGLREHAAKPDNQYSILTHALLRAREQVKRRAQSLLKDVPLPRKLLAPLAVISATEEALTQKLGHTPSDEELLAELKGNPVFNSLEVKSMPSYDHDKGKFNDGQKIDDDMGKLQAIRAAKSLQRIARLDRTVAGGGQTDDNEITAKETVADSAQALLDQAVEAQNAKERQDKLKVAVDKILTHTLEDRELMVIAYRFGLGGLEMQPNMQEIAELMGISVPMVKKLSASAMRKLAEVPDDIMKIVRKIYITKALENFNLLVKSVFTEQLSFTLSPHGLGLTDLEPKFVRRAHGSKEEIEKSLGVDEFIGSYVQVAGSNRMAATIVTYCLPEAGEPLQKAFSKTQNPVKRNASIKEYVTKHQDRYSALAAKQAKQFQASYAGKSGDIPWSVRLLLENPGSCWITWHGDHILINGQNGTVLYSSDSQASRAKYHADVPDEEVKYEYEPAEDEGHAAVAEDMQSLQARWNEKDENGRLIGGFVHDWRQEHMEANTFGSKSKTDKTHPDGWFLAKNPYTGKSVVYKVEIVEGKGKGKGTMTTAVTYAFDPDADVKVNIGDWNAVYRYLGFEKGTGNAYTDLMNKANTAGNHRLVALTEEEFNEMYRGTKEGARELMVHRNFRDVTPKTMKIAPIDPETGKRYSKEVAYQGSRIFECDLANGRVARFEITEDGQFDDPVMQKLIRPIGPIRDANDLYRALQEGVGNEVWVTIGSGRGHDLRHHVKLRYDGQGAPVVVGGAFEGYRFQDAAEMEDPEDKALSLMKNGRAIRAAKKEAGPEDIPFQVGAEVKVRDPRDNRHWVTAKIIGTPSQGRGWVVQLPKFLTDQGISFPNGADRMVMKDKQMRRAKEYLAEAQEAPVLDTTRGGMLRLAVPPSMQENFEADYGITLDKDGRADISMKQFLDIRDNIGSFSVTGKAQSFLEKFYAKQERGDMPSEEELLRTYNPANVAGYKEQSFLRKTNFYNSQVEGIHHLLTVKKGIAGHGMGAGKTLIGVGASMQLRAQAIAEGRKPGKTLVICPSAIRSEWLKEINRHTDVGAVILGSNSENGELFGYNHPEEDLRSRIIGGSSYKPDHPEHFVVMSYEQFMRNRERFVEWARQQGFANMVIDEVHAFKTEGGNRYAALQEVAAAFEHVHALSGTPMDNNVPDIYSLIHAITGGQHELGSRKEFEAEYLYKVGGKIAGMNESKLEELGKRLARYVHFRNGYDDSITYTNSRTGERDKVVFPKVDAPNRYHGTISYGAAYEAHSVPDKDAKGVPRMTPDGQPVMKTVNNPKTQTESQRQFYESYREMEQRLLTPAAIEAMEDVERSGLEGEKKNFLPAVQRLQQFVNAPLAAQVFRRTLENGTYELPNQTVDGYTRYYKANADGTDYERDAKGNPVLLPPLHQQNPKADHLKRVLLDYLDGWQKEQEARTQYNRTRAKGEPEKPLYPPKVVITSGYITFGTDVVRNVLRDIERDYNWSFGTLTGEDSGENRNSNVTEFQYSGPNSRHAFMVISDAGKEGINLGNAQMLIHYDQDFNPNKMAQKSARVLRSDSWKTAEAQGRPNEARIVSLAMPGTVEDYIFRTQTRKTEAMSQVERATRRAAAGGGAEQGSYATVREGSQRKWSQRVKGAVEKIKQLFQGEKKAAALVITELERRYERGTSKLG